MSTIRLLNGILWLLLGILIVIWLISPSDLLETVIWSGFAVGCIAIGLFEIQDNRASR